jgi:hypothetical protein
MAEMTRAVEARVPFGWAVAVAMPRAEGVVVDDRLEARREVQNGVWLKERTDAACVVDEGGNADVAGWMRSVLAGAYPPHQLREAFA